MPFRPFSQWQHSFHLKTELPLVLYNIAYYSSLISSFNFLYTFKLNEKFHWYLFPSIISFLTSQHWFGYCLIVITSQFLNKNWLTPMLKTCILHTYVHMDHLKQDCTHSIANALQLLHFCTKPAIWRLTLLWVSYCKYCSELLSQLAVQLSSQSGAVIGWRLITMSYHFGNINTWQNILNWIRLLSTATWIVSFIVLSLKLCCNYFSWWKRNYLCQYHCCWCPGPPYTNMV